MKDDPWERYLSSRFTTTGLVVFASSSFLMILIWLVSMLLGCTVTPHPVLSHSPSLDGTNRNSGLLGFSATGDCVLTEHAKQRYDSLVRRFGDRFEVPVKLGDGLSQTNGVWFLDPEHCADFETMTRWSISPQ